jgi:hypothetical protein
VNVHVTALLEMAFSSIEIAMHALDTNAAVAELTAIKGVIVVIKLNEGYSTPTVLKEAILKERFCKGILILRLCKNAGIGKIAKSQMLMAYFSLKAPVRIMVKAYACLIFAIKLQSHKAGISDTIIHKHFAIRLAVPDKRCIPAMPDDRYTQ